MKIFRALVAASVLVCGLVLTTAEADAMPVQPLAATASQQADVQSVYYYGYGYRRPFFRRGFYGYGFRRPFIGRGFYRGYGYRGYGYGYRGGYARRFVGSRAR